MPAKKLKSTIFNKSPINFLPDVLPFNTQTNTFHLTNLNQITIHNKQDLKNYHQRFLPKKTTQQFHYLIDHNDISIDITNSGIFTTPTPDLSHPITITTNSTIKLGKSKIKLNDNFTQKNPILLQKLANFGLQTLTTKNISKIINNLLHASDEKPLDIDHNDQPIDKTPEWYEILLNGQCGFNFNRYRPPETPIPPQTEILARKTSIINNIYNMITNMDALNETIPELDSKQLLIFSRIIFGDPTEYHGTLPPLESFYVDKPIQTLINDLLTPAYTTMILFSKYLPDTAMADVSSYLFNTLNIFSSYNTNFVSIPICLELYANFNKLFYIVFHDYVTTIINQHVDSLQLGSVDKHMYLILLQENLIWVESGKLLKKPFIKPNEIQQKLQNSINVHLRKIFTPRPTHGSVKIYNEQAFPLFHLKYGRRTPQSYITNTDGTLDLSQGLSQDSDDSEDLIITIEYRASDFSNTQDPVYSLNGTKYDNIFEFHHNVKQQLLQKINILDSQPKLSTSNHSGLWSKRDNSQSIDSDNTIIDQNPTDQNPTDQIPGSGSNMVESSDESSDEVFEIEEIVSHKTIRGKLLFRVKWFNYDSKHNTYEPEENFLGNDAKKILHNYANSNNLPIQNTGNDSSGSATEPDDSATEPDDITDVSSNNTIPD